MLKVKNVVSILAKVTFFFYSLSIYSQRDIEGIFSVDYGIKDFVTRYHFFDNNIFYMESAGDLGLTEYGKGHYLVKNDSLILNFDLTELKENGYHKH